MSNPNVCSTCDYMKCKSQDDGHCYMFEDAPTQFCPQHTELDESGRVFAKQPNKLTLAIMFGHLLDDWPV